MSERIYTAVREKRHIVKKQCEDISREDINLFFLLSKCGYGGMPRENVKTDENVGGQKWRARVGPKRE